MRTLTLTALFVTLLTQPGRLSDEMIRTIAERYLERRSIPVLDPQLGMPEALRAQATLLDLLKPRLGPVAGYKIGLITKRRRERFLPQRPATSSFSGSLQPARPWVGAAAR